MNERATEDYCLRWLSDDGFLRGAVAVTSQLVEEIRRRHGTDPTATVAIGRVTTGTALLGSFLKGNQRLAVTFEGNGPLAKLYAESDAVGTVRASLKVPIAGLPPRGNGYDVAGAVGRAGFLHVVKDLGMKEPYRGMVQLVSSEIGEDFAYYLTHSEQIPSSVGLGVALDGEGAVAAAGGFVVQAMPGCPEERIIRLEERISGLPSFSSLLVKGGTPEDLCAMFLGDWPYHEVARQRLTFRCRCSRGQVRSMLAMMDHGELVELAGRREDTVVTCEFCREEYVFAPEECARLAAKAGGEEGS